jgi:hypothetical protein
MVTVAAVSFFSSLASLVAFFGFRFWEERRGMRVLATLRATLDGQVSRIYRAAVMGRISDSWRRSLVASAHTLTHRVVVLTVDGLHAIERPLNRLSLRMRMRPPSANGKDVSAYLKSIAPDRKNDESQKTTDTL